MIELIPGTEFPSLGLTVQTTAGTYITFASGDNAVSSQPHNLDDAPLQIGQLWFDMDCGTFICKNIGEVIDYFPAIEPEMHRYGERVVESEGGSGAGYTDQNQHVYRGRETNEDRAIAISCPMVADSWACRFLSKIITDHIVPKTRHKSGGSTISIAMRSHTGRTVVATLGDSPVFEIMRDRKTGEIHLVQLNTPHSGIGEAIREASGLQQEKSIPFDTILRAAESSNPELVKDYKEGNFSENDLSRNQGLVRHLGKMRGKSIPPDSYEPELLVIHPKAMPNYPDSEFEHMGTMVCSDGIEGGIRCVAGCAVQEALTKLFAQAPKPSPELIAQTAVEAAGRFENDNVTAMVLPQGGEGLIAVADGNTQTARVAEIAIEEVRAACKAQTKGVSTVQPHTKSR